MSTVISRVLLCAVLVLASVTAFGVDFGRTQGGFEVSANGAATYTIPIWTPPGPNGVQPSIALTYSSANGNGLGGVGWAISAVSSIDRCALTVHQDGVADGVNLATTDRFCIDGNRLRLFSGTGTYGAASSVYFTEIADYSRITAYGTSGNGPQYFIVEAKSGLNYEYGKTSDSRVFAGVSPGAIATTPHRWMLNKVYDRNGNNYVIAYNNVNGFAVPDVISWTPTYLGSLSYRYEAKFNYFNTRTDKDSFLGKVKGFDVANHYRLTNIQIKSSGVVNRKYVLQYDTSTITERSRLITAKECADDAEANCFLPINFTYQTGVAGITAGTGTAPSGSANQIVKGRYDFNGDGKNDILYKSGTTWQAILGANSGFSGPYNTGITGSTIVDRFLPTGRDGILTIVGGIMWVYRWDDATSSFVGNSTGISSAMPAIAADYDGDGLADLVYPPSGGAFLISRRNTSTGSTNASFASTTNSTSVGGGNLFGGVYSYFGNGLKRMDINGDGRQDIYAAMLVPGSGGPVPYSATLLGVINGFVVPNQSTWVPATPLYPALNFNDDSCTDNVKGTVVLIAACNGIAASTFTLPATALLLDWDGDGKTDFLVNNGGTFGVYKSTGAGISSLISTTIPSAGSYFAMDQDGDQLEDLINVSSPAITYYTHTTGGYVGTDFATNVPDLLSTATDGFGVVATYSYASTSRSSYYNKGATTAYPVQEAPEMTVVAQLNSSSGIGTTFNKTYYYVGARSDSLRAEFIGFQRVDEADGRNNIIRRTYREQTFPVSGMVSQTEVMQPDGVTAISRVVPVNTFATLDPATNNQRFFPYSSGSTATQYAVEVGSLWNGALVRTVTSANTYETIGGSLSDQTVTTTEPASGANGVTAGGSWTTRTYIPTLLNSQTYLDNWCIGRPGRVQEKNKHLQSFGDEIIRTTDMSWDAVKCRPIQVTTEPEPTNNPMKVITDIAYDSFGNVNSTTVTGVGMTPRTSRLAYSDATQTGGQFLVSTEDAESVANSRNQKTLIAWDQNLGVPLSTTDPNGLTTSWQYDPYGRRNRETRPDGTASTWSIIDCNSFNYCPGELRLIVLQSELDTAGTVLYDIYDELDRFERRYDYYTKTLGEAVAGGPEYAIEQTRYDALGRVLTHSPPIIETFWNAAYVSTYTYDLANRVTQVSRPISAANLTAQYTTISYEGLTTRIVDPQSKQSVRVSNALGQIVRNSDHDGNYQAFDYDAFGNIKRVSDTSGTQLQAANYNIRGMLTQHTDMDMGTWSFTPNALGEVVSQTDAKNQTTTFTFDLLGRLTGRTEAEGTSTFSFGTSSAAKNIGRLASISGPGYSESHTFDSLGRPASTTVNADVAYQIDFTYNNQGRVDTLTYPASTNSCRLKLQYGYTRGELTSIADASNAAQCGSSGTVYWTANKGDGLGRPILETLGNGLVSSHAYDVLTGWPQSVQTGSGGGSAVQNLAYEWDKVGNLNKRIDKNQSNLTEAFAYDNVYRLSSSTLNLVPNLTMAYDALGNITSKSDVGAYTYDATKKHQVISTSNGWSFGYDNNGNMTSGRGASYTWTSFNCPACIYTGATCGSASMPYAQFSYTPNRQYWKQDAYFPASGSSPAGTVTTIYAGGLLEKVTTSGGTDYRHLIPAGSTTVVVSRQTNNVNNVYYVGSDQLGSLTTFTGTSLSQPVQTSFDAFGRRRDGDWSGGPNSADMTSIAGVTRRGYTAHTMLDNFELIHMNGRVQDPLLGRFVSADPFISEPLNTQGYNRYSYVYNNPLRMVDPSGFEACQAGDRWYNGSDFTRSYCGKDWSPPGEGGGGLAPGHGGPGEGGGAGEPNHPSSPSASTGSIGSWSGTANSNPYCDMSPTGCAGSAYPNVTLPDGAPYASPLGDWVDLTDGMIGRIDIIPGTDGLYEIHVYKDSPILQRAITAGNRSAMDQFERGVMGPDGRWLMKHSYTAPPSISENTYNTLRGHVADRGYRAEWIKKGVNNIKGGNLTREIQRGMNRAGVLKYLTRLGPVLGAAGVVLGAPSDKEACQYASYSMWEDLNCGL